MKKNQILLFFCISLFVFKMNSQPCNLQASVTKTLVNNVVSLSNVSTGTTPATTYTWTFHSGDFIYSAAIDYTTNAINPAPHTYTANGRNSIFLTASDNPTCVSTTTVWVDVCHFSPTLNYTQNPGGVLTFTTYSEGIYLQQEIMSYGDGTQDFHYPSTWNSIYTHTYFNGTYTPSNLVDYGHMFCFVTTTAAVISVTDNPCYADAGFTYTLGGGGAVQFSKNLPFNNTVATWNFGDGYTSTLSNPSHTYTSGGIFNVSLDSHHPIVPPYNYNCHQTNSVNVNITGIPCIANANFTIQPTGQLHTYWITPANPYNVSYALWSWGDGDTTSSSNIYANHTFSAAGTYDVCLTVTTSCGASSNSASYCSTQYMAKGTTGDMIGVSVIEPALISGIQEVDIKSIPMELFPNPTDGLINIKLGNEPGLAEIEIYDVLGKKVYSESGKNINGSIKTDVSQLNNGIYFLYLKLPQKDLSSKIIISK